MATVKYSFIQHLRTVWAFLKFSCAHGSLTKTNEMVQTVLHRIEALVVTIIKHLGVVLYIFAVLYCSR